MAEKVDLAELTTRFGLNFGRPGVPRSAMRSLKTLTSSVSPRAAEKQYQKKRLSETAGWQYPLERERQDTSGTA